jgi:hypothetical protein
MEQQAMKTVCGVEVLMDPGQVAIVLGRPVRWVRESLLKPGLLRSVRLGGNSFRVRPSELARWIESNIESNQGFRHSRPSGGCRKTTMDVQS